MTSIERLAVSINGDIKGSQLSTKDGNPASFCRFYANGKIITVKSDNNSVSDEEKLLRLSYLNQFECYRHTCNPSFAFASDELILKLEELDIVYICINCEFLNKLKFPNEGEHGETYVIVSEETALEFRNLIIFHMRYINENPNSFH